MTDDTETLIATVLSLLYPSSTYATSVILDTILQFDGDTAAAAEHLNAQASSDTTKPSSKKRKRANTISSWLESTTKPKSARSERAHSKPPSSSAKPPSAKPATDLMSILRPPPSSDKKRPSRLPPLLLSNPEMVVENTPCTLHLSVLPPELACKLFYTMVDASKSWKRNKWWLFDRLVESPHRTSFFARKNDGVGSGDDWQEAAQFWYNGSKTVAPPVFPELMEEACHYIEAIVNAELRKRPRLPLEWAGSPESEYVWHANVAASNCYEGAKETVGFHSDQMTYLGPYCTIASLSLGTRRIFSLREVIPTHEKETRSAQTFQIPLAHNSLTIMHATCQERYKHSIPPQSSMDMFRPSYPKCPGEPIEPSNCRINITFRFYRPDFHPSTTPRCKCGVPTILRPDMKNRSDGKADKYWWTCYAGAQNDGKGCNFWRVLDMEAEGRGPIVGPRNKKDPV